MSFKSATLFLVALLFILFGTLALLLPWSESVRYTAIHFIEDNIWPWNLFGLAFILIGITMGFYLKVTRRRHYYTLQMGAHDTLVHQNVVDGYLQAYWERVFPMQEIPYRLTLRRKKIKLSADLPFASADEQKKMVDQIQNDLSDIFRRLLGYQKNLALTLSFEKEPRKR